MWRCDHPAVHTGRFVPAKAVADSERVAYLIALAEYTAKCIAISRAIRESVARSLSESRAKSVTVSF